MTKRPLGICFLCSDYPPGLHGGIGTVTRLLAHALSAAGHRVRVLGVYHDVGPEPVVSHDGAVEVTRLPARPGPGGWIRDRLRVFRHVRRWIAEGAVDIVEAPDWEGPTACWPWLGAPVVARCHGSATLYGAELGRPVSSIARWLERASLRRAGAICYVSDYVRIRMGQLFGAWAGGGRVIYNPVEAAPFVSVGERDRARVVFTGTLVERKGVPQLLRAWPAVVARCPEAELHLYGKDIPDAAGVSRGAAFERSVPPEVRRTVRFHGHVGRTEVFAALSQARAAVFPSYAEAFAIAPLEAMVTGCPTVYTRRGSGPELIDDGTHGLLIEPDRSDELADAIVRLLRDDALADRVSRAGQARVLEHFSLDRCVQRTLEWYAACLGTAHDASEVAHAA